MAFIVRSAALSCLAASFFSLPLFSQTELADSLLQRIKLQEVVVQATRASSNSPVPHTNFSAENISRQYHAQDIPFLLSSVPSLVETSDAGAGVGYTGMRIRGSDPTRVNVTINGVPLNDAESQAVFWVNLPDLASSASEIQVQRGVGTSTNGAGAFGSTVNLDLSRVSAEPFAVMSNALGSFNTRKHSLRLGTGLLDSRWAFTGRFSGIFSDGYVDRASAALRAAHLSAAYLGERQTFQFHLLSGQERTYQAWYGLPAQYLEQPELRTYNPAGTERPSEPYRDEVDNYVQRHYMAHYKRSLAKHIFLQLNAHYTRGYGYFEQYKADQRLSDYSLPLLPVDTVTPPMDLVRRRWLDNHFYGSTFALRWRPDSDRQHSLMLGGAWSRYKGAHFGELIWVEFFAGAQNDFRYYDNNARKQDANIFVKWEYAPVKPLMAFVDLQWRHVGYSFWGFNNFLENVQQTASLGFFNPKVGAAYALPRRGEIYVFAGMAHREPNRDDYTQSTPNSRPKPEQLFDLEAGWRKNTQSWSASANLFWMQYRNQLILNGRINDVGAYIRANVPNSWRAGLELEGSAALGQRLKVSGNLAWSQNKIKSFAEYRDNWDSGEQEILVHHNTNIAFSPSLIARAEVTGIIAAKSAQSLSVTLTTKHVGHQFLDNTSNPNTSLSGYWVSDWRINFDLNRFWGGQVHLLLSVNNLFDMRYANNGWAYRYRSESYDARPDNPYTRYEGGGIYHQAGFFPQAGRHYMATLQLVF